MSRRELLQDRREQLRLQTGKDLARYAETLTAIEERGGEAPRPGDLFLFAETADLPVEWTVLERDPKAPKRLLVVPADWNPVLGSGDVAVPAGTSTGVLTLRCRFGVWLDTSDFDPEMRSGFLEPACLAQAQDKRRQVAKDPVSDSLPICAPADEPDYMDWEANVLRKAQFALSKRARRPADERTPAVPSRLSGALFSPLGLTAALLLSAGLALAGGAVWHLEKIAEVRSKHQIEEPVLNLPYVWLVPKTETVRGDAANIILPKAADLMHLILELRNPGPYSRFQLEILRNATGENVWSTGELSRIETVTVSVGLPSRLLGAGEYRLLLYGLSEESPKLLETYELRVERE